MSVEVFPFEVADLETLDVYPRYRNARLTILSQPDDYAHKLETPFSWTMWHPAGWPIGCAGINPLTDEAWAFLGRDMRRYMVPFSRAVRKFGLDPYLERCGPPLAYVDRDHPEAYRWVKLLGFRHLEGHYWIYDAPPSHSR